MENTIEKKIQVKAPVGKVWKALTDSKQFGEWFGAIFNQQFAVGKSIICELTKSCAGSEHAGLKLNMQIVEINEPKHYFSYKWNPFAIDREYDYSKEEPTLVEFFLKETSSGTELLVKESGFTKLPESRRADAFRANSGGWEHQLENIKNYAEKPTGSKAA